MAEVTLIVSQQTSSPTFNEVGPQFSNQDSRLGPVIEKAKKLSTLQYPRSTSVSLAILISKLQPCELLCLQILEGDDVTQNSSTLVCMPSRFLRWFVRQIRTCSTCDRQAYPCSRAKLCVTLSEGRAWDKVTLNSPPHSATIPTTCTYLLENVEHCGGKPEQAYVLWLHAHEQTKLHAEMMS